MRYCGNNSVLTGISLNTALFEGGHTDVVNKLILECNIFDINDHAHPSQFHRLVFGQDDGHSPLSTEQCRPAFSRITGFRVRDGIYVDSLGIICTKN